MHMCEVKTRYVWRICNARDVNTFATQRSSLYGPLWFPSDNCQCLGHPGNLVTRGALQAWVSFVYLLALAVLV